MSTHAFFLSIENDRSTYQLLSIEQTLEPILPRIEQLAEFIQLAKARCHFPSEHNLTQDESAAIFLYTMKWDNDLFYATMKRDLASKVPTIAQAWSSYLMLFDRALQKLPSRQLIVWRGMNGDVCTTWKKNDLLIWRRHMSCSSSATIIRDGFKSNSKLCSIAAINGKEISLYSQYPNEHEVILCPDTRLRVVRVTEDQASSSPIIHLRECPRPVESNRLISSSVILIIALLLVTIFGKMLNNSLSTCTHVDSLGNRYEGQCLDGKKHGKGTMHYANGYIYTGDWIGDMANGEGIFTWPNGDRYEGHFIDDQRHGSGSYQFANGDLYTGDWAQDKKEGFGVSTLDTGKYEGEFKDDKMHGTGTFHFVDGSTYIGQWVDNRQDGEGAYYFPDGNKFTGDWINGERVIDHGTLTRVNTDQPFERVKT